MVKAMIDGLASGAIGAADAGGPSAGRVPLMSCPPQAVTSA